MKLFLALLALWLVLNESFTPGHWLLGAVLALGGVAVYSRLQPAGNRLRNRPLAVLRLLGLVLADIVRSNVAVARIVLGLAASGRTAGFLSLPLELRHPGALAVLACIITATPGTTWVRYDRAAGVVTIHVLDLVDEQAWVRLFKERYESRLLEIFE
jgi:multicomponent K+:H+ antiporter subunit E